MTNGVFKEVRKKLFNELDYLESQKEKLWKRYFTKPTCAAQKQVLKSIDDLTERIDQIKGKLKTTKENK